MKNELRWWQFLLSFLALVGLFTLVGIDRVFGKREGEERGD